MRFTFFTDEKLFIVFNVASLTTKLAVLRAVGTKKNAFRRALVHFQRVRNDLSSYIVPTSFSLSLMLKSTGSVT